MLIRRFSCALLAAVLLASGAFAREAPGLVRLHVVAEDDSPAAQALKLELRDTCLACARACLFDAPDAAAAYMRLQQAAPAFERACRLRARELDYNGTVTACVGVFPFPDRIYGNALVPAGDYPALRITIGRGEGRNWWCVLYPGLCWADESAGEDASGILSWLKKRLGGV